jgi:hypothetical protein
MGGRELISRLSTVDGGPATFEEACAMVPGCESSRYDVAGYGSPEGLAARLGI